MAKEQFSNRWGIIFASLGMAIGAGNLWRFPRLAGQYGGSFILLWVLFLLLWSIPLLLSEFAIGKKFKRGVIGSFSLFAGRKSTWMGFFITVCTLGIAFYYAIVAAWSFRYLGFSVQQLFVEKSLSVTLEEDPAFLATFWEGVANGSWVTIVCYIGIIFLGLLILKNHIQNGLEKANKLLIPSLFVLLIVIIFVSLSMEGGLLGLEYMFKINVEHFKNPTIWVEALSQSAWSTGAGWGLMMTLSSYSRAEEDVTLNTFIGAFGNNVASLLSGVAILPAVFALTASSDEAVKILTSGNQALTFTIIPHLFANVAGGSILCFIFFLALFIAAFSSLLPMMSLMLKNLADLNLSKRLVVATTAICFIMFGLPSAWSLDFFSNQDWVWGVGLIISGLFLSIVVAKTDIVNFKRTFIDKGSDMIFPTVLFRGAIYLNICLAIFLIYWWLTQDFSASWFDSEGNWDLMGTYSNASTITQWGVVILCGWLLNNYLFRKFASSK